MNSDAIQPDTPDQPEEFLVDIRLAQVAKMLMYGALVLILLLAAIGLLVVEGMSAATITDVT